MSTQGNAWRELESSAVVRQYGLTWLQITVRRRAGVSKKTGEVRYKLLHSNYLVERPAAGVLTLVTCREGKDGTPLAYEVTPHACTCPDGRYRPCKHRSACLKHRLFSTFGGKPHG